MEFEAIQAVCKHPKCRDGLDRCFYPSAVTNPGRYTCEKYNCPVWNGEGAPVAADSNMYYVLRKEKGTTVFKARMSDALSAEHHMTLIGKPGDKFQVIKGRELKLDTRIKIIE